jgi:hypothetical protein
MKSVHRLVDIRWWRNYNPMMTFHGVSTMDEMLGTMAPTHRCHNDFTMMQSWYTF